MKSIPKQAQVVIIGGGVIGCSVAYHLTKLGWTDVVLLERKELTCGTTWHAAGLVGQLRATKNMTKLAQYTSELYATLEDETGQATGFKQNGSISVAPDAGRFEELKRGASMAKCFGLEVEVISPHEAREMYPLLNIDDLEGAVFLPKDGQTNPIDVTQALAKGAKMGGAKIFENVRVCGIETKSAGTSGARRVSGVEIEHTGGSETKIISAEIVVNCAGLWGHQVGKMAGVNVPLHAAEHFYIVTEDIGLPSNLPVLRDPSSWIYAKEDAGKMLVGCFEPKSKPRPLDSIPEDFSFGQFAEDWDHFEPAMLNAMHRIPKLEDAGIHTFFNGPESFTPDDRYILGEAPELSNFYVAAGLNSIGIQSAGGAGKVLSEWIVNGHPPLDLWDVDIRRFHSFQGNSQYLKERIEETLGLLYAMHWPFRQSETSRGVRKSVLHDRLEKAGACFGEMSGWERANWFAPEGKAARYKYSYARQNWFEASASEHRAAREKVALFDMSSFAKFMVQGRDAEKVLNRICANDVAVVPGKAVYTSWLNERGGIESDLTVTRLQEDVFLVITAGASQTRDLAWLHKNIPDKAHVTVTDVTSGYAVLSVMGPESRKLLSKLTPANLSNEAFPFGTGQEIEIGYGTALALRMTYVGELGWEIYAPTEFAQDIYDKIIEAGNDYGLQPGGMHALNSLRLEKAFRHWGHDITDEDTPLEAGLGFAVKFDKPGGFIGRDALLRQKEELSVSKNGVLKKRLVQFGLENPEPLLYHNEPIWCKQAQHDKIVGDLTSGMYGHTVETCLGMGYVSYEDGVSKDFLESSTFEIEVAGERHRARASLRAFYDPKSERVRM
ncbi:MAG TPA: FAD-dependent oxidoreductase [Candidatus Lambdaproteobacteria bacterium]|nr:FAD-dependent oxidoreductase [Candidatus Lambdaproteobacteria bacterium]